MNSETSEFIFMIMDYFDSKNLNNLGWEELYNAIENYNHDSSDNIDISCDVLQKAIKIMKKNNKMSLWNYESCRIILSNIKDRILDSASIYNYIDNKINFGK